MRGKEKRDKELGLGFSVLLREKLDVEKGL
jgi:hypothetical protein